MKLCKDCKFYTIEAGLCIKHPTRTNMVDGVEISTCCYGERNSIHPDACGSEARFFEPKVGEMKLEWKHIPPNSYDYTPERLRLYDPTSGEIKAHIYIFSDIAIALRRNSSEGGRSIYFQNTKKESIISFKQRVETAIRNRTWEAKI